LVIRKEFQKGKEREGTKFQGKNMSRREYMIRKLKREIRKEIAVETAALKKLIPLFFGSAVLCTGGYAWISFLLGIMH
jgi:hypothetical protein